MQSSLEKSWKIEKDDLSLQSGSISSEVAKKNLLKRFGNCKNSFYLCSPIRIVKHAGLFETGSLNYWLYLREKEM